MVLGGMEARCGHLHQLRLRGGMDYQRARADKKELLPSFMRRRPKDCMSLARRELNAQLFTPEGMPDMRMNDAQRRVIHDQVVQWTWLQCRLRYAEIEQGKVVREFEERVAITEEEAFDYTVLHYLIVEAHTADAAEFMTRVGIDGTPYVRADDPLRATRVRPMTLDKHELFNASAIETREALREALESGNISAARKVVDEGIGPEFWAEHPEALFRLLLQRLMTVP